MAAIKATTWAWEQKELFFSDGSVSILEENSRLKLNKLNFPKWDNLNTVVKIYLWAGTIWTRATHLNDESAFEVYTSDSAAAVRWTVFWVKKDSITETIVQEWVVEVTEVVIVSWTEIVKWGKIKNPEDLSLSNIISVTKDEKIKSLTTSENILKEAKEYTRNEINLPNFSVSDEIEDTYTKEYFDANIIAENLSASCYLDWEEIKNWGSKIAYQFNDANCEFNQNRTCTDWILDWDSSYKFASCNESSCPSGQHEEWWNCEDDEKVCYIWILEWEKEWDFDKLDYWECKYELEDIIPWTQLALWTLSWEFKIELKFSSIPSTKQYLLYWNNNFKFFFGNIKGDICYQYQWELAYCTPLWWDKEVTIERDSSWNIILNWNPTSYNTSIVLNTLNIWFWKDLWSWPLLLMDSSNKINIEIKK